jgi:glycosyltransferase involved in cell wall biosynthesis
MDKKIKIAYFTDVLVKGLDGVTNTVFNIIERFPADKYDVRFITPYPPENIDDFPFPVFVCKFLTFPFYRDYRVAVPYYNNRSLKKVLGDFNPDLVHFTTPSFLGKYAIRYAKAHNIKISTTYHTHFISYVDYYIYYSTNFSHIVKLIGKKMMKWFYNNCDLIFVPSLPLFHELDNMGIDLDRLYLWGRGVDNSLFTPELKDKNVVHEITGNNSSSLLYVGRIVWEKDIKVLVDIYNSFEKSDLNISMIITGDGPQKKILQKRMPNAIFTGILYGKELARLYASCDVFVFPSSTETFGNVVLEAMASGTPVVVSSKGGQVGYVKDGYSGLVAKEKDPVDFTNKIKLLLSDPSLHNKLRTNALKYAKLQSWDTLVQKLFAKYEELYDHKEN